MSRNVPRDKPLSDEDRAYLLMLGKDSTVAYIDQQYPPDAELEDAELDDEDDDEDDDEAPDYSTLTVAELQAEIERRNKENGTEMPVTGTKPVLIARLEDDDE